MGCVHAAMQFDRVMKTGGKCNVHAAGAALHPDFFARIRSRTFDPASPVVPHARGIPASQRGHASAIGSRAAKWRACVGAAVLALVTLPVSAQVQRNYLNPSFEVPALIASNNAAGCWLLVNEAAVPGWTTTHPTATTGGDCTNPLTAAGPVLELWRTNYLGVVAPHGNSLAELNAYFASRLYQNVCLINGESIPWQFSHRGRASESVADVAAFNIGASVPIVTVSTTNNGTMPAGTPVVNQGSINTPGGPTNGWRNYSGTFTYTGATGVTAMGFEAISSAGGIVSVGNLLDNIQIQLRPFIEFSQANSSTPESASSNRPTLRVNGTAFQDITVTIQVTGGTAALGVDYATPTGTDTFTVVIPGSPTGIQYDGVSASSLFALPVTVTSDTLVEANETISFSIVPPSGAQAPFLLNSSTSCGAPAQQSWAYTIVDDDSAISVVKNSTAPTPVPGQPSQFDVVYTVAVANTSATVAANYALVEQPGFDVDASVISARYVRNAEPAVALTGAGPWILQPQWRALAGGQSDTYVLTVRLQIARGGSVANDTCASPSANGGGLHNSAEATLQGAAGQPNPTFSDTACENTPTPAWVTLRKQLQGRVAPTDQAQVRIYAGGTVAASATTNGSAVPANVSTALLVVPAGTTVQFDEAIKTNGTGADRPLTQYRPSISCTSAGVPVTGLPTGAGTNTGLRQVWPDFTGIAGADVDCTITNAVVRADLSITKTNNSTTVVAGGTTSYTIVVANAGPEAADGAVLRDPAVPGLQCNTVSCGSATGGAVCPSVTPAALQSAAGVTIATLPANSSLTFTLGCSVQ